MATIRAYTTIEQSRKLAEILPLETADMYYACGAIAPPDIMIGNKQDYRCYTICWSLAALLDVLPDYTLQTNTDGTVFVICNSKKPMISDAYNNPIDACYEMIIKLNELNLL